MPALESSSTLWKGSRDGKLAMARPPVSETFHGNQQRAGLLFFSQRTDHGGKALPLKPGVLKGASGKRSGFRQVRKYSLLKPPHCVGCGTPRLQRGSLDSTSGTISVMSTEWSGTTGTQL